MRCLGQGGSGLAGALPGMAQTSANVTSQYEAASNIWWVNIDMNANRNAIAYRNPRSLK